MQKLKKAADACSNPPHFRGVKTPITELLDAEDKPKRDANANPKRDGDKKEHGRRDKAAQLQSRQNTARDLRPVHEKPSAFTSGLKRPDPTSTFEGRKFSNDAQRQLFDDIKGNRCTRCHKEGHLRSKCTLPAEKWEDKFDREKGKYWESVLRWQGKAADEKKGSSPTPPKPALVPKKENHRAELAWEFSSEDDANEPLQSRVMRLPDPDSEEDE
jgi:hypothetical protein